MTLTPLRALETALYALLNLAPYLALALALFSSSLRFGRRGTAWLIAALCVLQIGLGFAVQTVLRAHAGLASVLTYAIYIVFFALAVRAALGQITFMLLVIANYASFVVTLSKCLEYHVFGLIALEGYRWTFSLATAVVQLVTLPPLALLLRRQLRPLTDLSGSERMWRYLWLVPLMFYGVWFYLTYFSDTERSSLEIAIRPGSSVFLLCVNIGSFLVYSGIARMMRDGAERLRLESENHQLAMRNLQFSHLESRIEEARRERHDFRQHCNVLISYCEQGRYDEVRGYLESLRQQTRHEGQLTYCRNADVNAIAVYHLDMARDAGAALSVKLDLPEKLPIQTADLAVLLGNLLENAVEALRRQTEGEKFLRLNASVRGALFLTLDNSYRGAVHETERGFLSSTREGPGIGVASVQAIAAKYHGIAKFEHDGSVFRASVMLDLHTL